MTQLQLEVISQEKPLLTDQVDLVLLPSTQGELGILPNHIPLITKLNPGVVTARKAGQDTLIAIGGGFATMEPNNHLTILADTAVKAEDISLKAAQAAQKAAQDKMKQKDELSTRDFRVAEAQLRKALAQLQAVRKRQPQSNLAQI